MELPASLKTPRVGLNHADFSRDGRTSVASCEISGELLLSTPPAGRWSGRSPCPGAAEPQDVKVSPDGKTSHVANLNRDGPGRARRRTFEVTGLRNTGAGAHSRHTSRESRDLHVTNRWQGSVSIVDVASGTARATRRLPRGASPDMGNSFGDGWTL